MEPGRYKAKAIDRQFGKTAKGNEQILVIFAVTDDGPHKSKKLYWYGYFTEKTIDRTLESLEHCGWDGTSLKELKGFGTQEVELDVGLEKNEQDGKEYVRVRWVNRLGGGPGKKMEELDSGGMSALEERVKGALLARKESRAAENDTSFPHGANATGGDGPPV
jgi:hypothetical protein